MYDIYSCSSVLNLLCLEVCVGQDFRILPGPALGIFGLIPQFTIRCVNHTQLKLTYFYSSVNETQSAYSLLCHVVCFFEYISISNPLLNYYYGSRGTLILFVIEEQLVAVRHQILNVCGRGQL